MLNLLHSAVASVHPRAPQSIHPALTCLASRPPARPDWDCESMRYSSALTSTRMPVLSERTMVRINGVEARNDFRNYVAACKE